MKRILLLALLIYISIPMYSCDAPDGLYEKASNEDFEYKFFV